MGFINLYLLNIILISFNPDLARKEESVIRQYPAANWTEANVPVDKALQSSKIYDHSFLQILEIIGNPVDFFISSHIKLASFSSSLTLLEAGHHLV